MANQLYKTIAVIDGKFTLIRPYESVNLQMVSTLKIVSNN